MIGTIATWTARCSRGKCCWGMGGGAGAFACSHLCRFDNFKNGGMPMCFVAPIRARLRPFLRADDCLVHLSVRAKEVRPAVMEKFPIKKFITKLSCGPPGCSESFLYTR